ncbi:MAG: hypothetical protein QCI38_05175 [Candidatus Thermoplasmatota archaeon]|nr:hypothetical protein [Candidatus Thermoplasmatota archaeon]
MDIEKIMNDTMKWFKNPKTVKALAMYFGVTILLALDFAFWAGAIETIELGASPVDDVIIDDGGDTENYTLFSKVLLEQSGSGGIMSGSSGATSTIVDFVVDEGCTRLLVNLTVSSSRLRPDYDLHVTSPDGKSYAAATETANEQLEVVAKGNGTLPAGTWKCELIYWSATLGSTWELTAVGWFMEECGDDGCAAP